MSAHGKLPPDNIHERVRRIVDPRVVALHVVQGAPALIADLKALIRQALDQPIGAQLRRYAGQQARDAPADTEIQLLIGKGVV